MMKATRIGAEELTQVLQDAIDNDGTVYMVATFDHKDGKSGSGTHTFYWGDKGGPNNLYSFMRKAFNADPKEITKFRTFQAIVNDAIEDHGKPNG